MQIVERTIARRRLFAPPWMTSRDSGQLSAWSFSTVLHVMPIGWMVTEVVKEATGAALGQLGRVTHFAVMILFSGTMTLQLRRSSGK